MINRVVLIGRLTRDVELRYTGSGVANSSFTIAVNRNFKNANGEREADFINCVIWRKAAENFANFTKKGSLVGIEGRLQTRNYENQQGQRVYVTEVVVENFSFLEPKSATNQRPVSTDQQNFGQQTPSFENHSTNDFANPQTNTNQQNDNQPLDPFANNGQQLDISDDDLPF